MLPTGETVKYDTSDSERVLHGYKLNTVPLIQLYVDEERMEVVYAVDYRGERPGQVAKEPKYEFFTTL